MGGRIQLTDALLNVDVLNALETDAGIHDCGDKQDFMCANLPVGIQDSDTREEISRLFQENECKDSLNASVLSLIRKQ